MPDRVEGFELSVQQARLWSLLPGGPGPYRSRCAVVLPAALDEQRLEQAIATVVARHEILRTTFETVPGFRTAVQVVSAGATPALERVDPGQGPDVGVACDEHLLRPDPGTCDLAVLPLVRWELVRPERGAPVLVVRAPALCADQRSLRNLVDELAAAYHGEPGAPDSDVLQYAGYAAWQSELAAEQERASGGVSPQQGATGDPPRLPDQTVGQDGRFDPRCVRRTLTSLHGRRLRAVAEAGGCGSEALLLACWAGLLRILTAADVVPLSVLVDGRGDEELGAAQGLYEHRLPLDLTLRPAEGIHEVARAAGRAFAGLRVRQDQPGREQPPGPDGRGRSDRGAFGFAYREHRPAGGRAGFEILDLYSCTGLFGVELHVEAHGSELGAALHFDAGAYTEEAAGRLLERFEAVLDQALSRPGTAVGALEACTAREREQQLVEWNATGVPGPARALAGELVADQAARTPAAVALVCGDRRVTYEQLDTLAGRVAGALRAEGAGRGARVAICLEPSPELVAAVLGTWKAGAAYVPLNPEDPPLRLALTLERARCDAVVTTAPLAGLAPLPRAVVRVDEIAEVEPLAAGEPGRPGDVAYVAFTSGSTGRPHGVVAHHRGVLNYLAYVSRTYDLGRRDVVLQLAPFTFDAWLRDCLAPLTAGASVVLPGSAERRDSAALLGAVRDHGVTRLLHVVPTRLRDLTGVGLERGLGGSTVRTILSSGEVLHPEDCERARETFGRSVAIVNQYGPTECTLTTTFEVAGEVVPGQALAIGRPIPGARVHVLGEAGQVLPVGAVGEIVVAGEGVTYGYLDEPGLTAQRFVPDAYGDEPGGRAYRTGDLGRLREDGTLEFAGRRDHQVKVGGIRVELGEIEAAAAAHPGVREAAAVARDGGTAGARVVACVVGEAGTEGLTAEAVQRWLQDRLPPGVVPAVVVREQALPRGAHGKVDRRRLAVEVEESRSGGQRGRAPQTALEEQVCAVFARVLGRRPAGIDDNFFALGGHSLSATRLVYELGEKLGVDLPLRSIFEAPTVAQLAERVRAAAAGQGAGAGVEQLATRPAGEVPAVRAPDRIPRQPAGLDAYPTSFAQRRLWLADALEPGDAANNVQVAVRVRGRLDVDSLRAALDHLVQRHEMLRTTFPGRDGEPVQVIGEPFPVELPVAALPVDDRTARLRQELQRLRATRFDLARLPLHQVRLLRVSPDEHVLCWTLHHIVIDEWSVGVLLEELLACYGALADGRDPDLPAPAPRYVDFAAWQRQQLTGQGLRSLLATSVERLRGARFDLELRGAKPRPAVPSARGGRLSASLPPALTRDLARLAQERGVTVFMLFLAAFKILLSYHAGEDDIVVGSPIAGRTHPDLDGLVGFCSNILVLRTDLAGDPAFPELLDRVRSTALDGFGHQDLPFEELVEALRPRRIPHRMPLINIWFVLHNTPLPPLEGSGIELSLFDPGSATAKFDLNLALFETPGGIDAAVEYSTDQFDEEAARGLLRRYEALLRAIVAEPTARLSTLHGQIAGMEEEERTMAAQQRASAASASFSAFASSRAPAVRVSTGTLVRRGRVVESSALPVLVEPAAEHLDLAEWVASNLESVAGDLREAGGVLFRGFGIDSAEAFQEVARAYSPHLVDYYERSTPRQKVGGKVYTSTDYPPERTVPLHPESAYSHRWPRTIWFCCLEPAGEGGATPVADSRQTLAFLDPGVRQRFVERGVMYVRNYHEGFDIPWQVAFQTEERQVVEEYCRRTGMTFEWSEGGVLRTRHVLDAVVRHPGTGEEVWFNQVHASHVAALDEETREALRGMFTEDGLPRSVCYGDGSPISDADIEAVRDAHRRAVVSFPWQAGDVLALDNMLVAHGREPYRGSRTVVVAMTDPYDRDLLAGEG